MSAATTVSAGPSSIGARSHHPVCAVVAVLLASFVVGLHSRMFTIGFADLKGAFSLGFDEGSWLNTAATASQILISPAVAWLCTVFGVRRILGVPSLVYALISLIIPLTRDYETLMVLHVIHGMLLGVFVPATLMVILRNLSMQWWLPGIAIYAFRMAFTIYSGGFLVGYYVQTLGWQWLYWQDVALAPLIALLAHLGAPKEAVQRPLLRRADWGGMLFFGCGLALLYAGLDQGNRLDWSSSGIVVALLGGSVAVLLAFLVNEALVAEPWASTKVLLSRNVGLMLLTAVMFMLTSVSAASLVPNFLSTVAQLRPEQTGLLFLHYGAMPLFIFVPAAVFLLRRFDPRFSMILGLGCFAVASLMGTRLTGDWAPEDFRLLTVVQSAGYGFTFVAVIIYGFSNVNPTRAVAFSAYIQVLRLVGVELGVALMSTWLRVREQVHSSLLGQHVASGDPVVTHALEALGGTTAQGINTLSGLVREEANVLAYIDGFWMTFLAAMIGLVAVAFMKGAPRGPFTPRHPLP